MNLLAQNFFSLLRAFLHSEAAQSACSDLSAVSRDCAPLPVSLPLSLASSRCLDYAYRAFCQRTAL